MHLKTSLDNIKRDPFQALAAISVLTVTFFVTTLIAIIVYSSNQLIKYFETRPQVIAFLIDEVKDDEIASLKQKLENDPRVRAVRFVSKEEALGIYKEATSDNPLLGELVSPSIFPASIEFSPSELTHAQALIEEVKEEKIVESVGFTASVGGESAVSDVINRLKNISYYVRIAGASAVAVLALTSFLVLMVVIGLRIVMKKDEIESLSLIGATPGFIRAPLLLEAVHYAVIGVFSGWLLASVLIMYASPSIFSYFGEIAIIPTETKDFFLLLAAFLGGELLVGIVIALIGSYIAASRSLKIR